MKTSKILFFALLLVTVVQGCDLDREPADYINYEDSFRNMQDAKKWDNGIYSTLRGKFGGGYVLPQEAQADMLNAHAAFNSLYAAFHGWTLLPESNVIQEIYHSYYAALVDANVVIELLPRLQVGEEEKPNRNHYLGDAYFARAFYHFNLALRWGEPYEESTADKTLGIPLVLIPKPLEKPGRATNRETYKQILKDLQEAETLLTDVSTKAGNTEISADAVRALRARVYLYIGDMEKAFAEAKQLIDKGIYPLITAYKAKLNSQQKIDPREDAFAQMWFYDSGVEQIWQPYVAKENEIPTVTNLYGADLSTTTHWDGAGVPSKVGDYNKPPYVPTKEVMNTLFATETDHRALSLFEFVKTTVSDVNNSTELYVISKFKGNPNYATLNSTHWGGYVPNGNQAPKPFRIAEQYLIAAEAAHKLNRLDAAKEYLNTLRISRGMPVTTLDGEALYEEIKNERARELAFEGFRLWDLRRWKQGIGRRSHQGAKGYYQVPGSFYAAGFRETMNIRADNYRFVWPFPKNEITINKKIKQNAGWDK